MAPTNPLHSDVLVLGGGVIGLATALFLLRAGRSVRVLERANVGAGSSHGNCGTITPSHLPLNEPATIVKGLKWMLSKDAPLHIQPSLDLERLGWLLRFARHCNARDFRRIAEVRYRLLQASRERLTQLIRDESLDCEFVETGTCYVYRKAASFDKAHRDVVTAREIGVPVEALDGDSVRAREPALNDSIVGAHWYPGDARLRPNRYVAELARAVREAGGEIVEQAPVSGFQRDAGRIGAVEAGGRRYAAAELVFALGAWSPLVGREIGLKLPIQPGKGYSITYSRPARSPWIPMVLKERQVCVTPWDTGYRLGSTMEFSGYDDSLNPTRLAALERGAAEYLHDPVGPKLEERWSGWRPMVPDELPIIGRAPNLDNLWLATGHGMLGVSMSAITAQLVSELIGGQTPSLDVTPFAPTRFQ